MEQDFIDYRRFIEGDEQGLVALVERYRLSLFRFIQTILHDPVLSEEVMEDSFAALFLHRNKFRFSSSFKTYLFRIAKNRAMDILRRRKRVFSDIQTEKIPSSDNDPLLLFIRQEQSQELFCALSSLSPLYRAVLYLLYVEEMSYKEAGDILKKSQKQIKNLAFRAREAARKQTKGDLS